MVIILLTTNNNESDIKVLINGLQLSDENSGVQYYTNNLLKEIRKLEDLQIKALVSKSYFPNIGVSDKLQFQYVDINSKNRLKRIYYENLKLHQFLRQEKFNLYHATNYLLPYFSKFKSVLTIHDLIAINHPQFCQNESVIYFSLLQSRSIKQATKIIAVSNTVKNEIIKKYNVPPEKIVTIYHGVNENFKKENDSFRLNEVKVKYNLPDKFILFVGNIEPKKNLKQLIEAYNLLRKKSEIIHKLVIVGKKGWKYNDVFKKVNELKLDKQVFFNGYIPEDDLPVIYSLADLFVFPSLYEGFGIPPLEAMACEIPVLVSNRGALPEITGGKCIQINPLDIEDIAEGMYNLITDNNLRKKSIEDSKNWVKTFTWEKAAKETVQVYEKIV